MKEYLFKASVSAVFFHGLEIREFHFTQAEISGKKTDKAQSKMAKG
jgi:hypothetical protein